MISNGNDANGQNSQIVGTIQVYGNLVQLSDLIITQDIIPAVVSVEIDTSTPVDIDIDPTDQKATRDFLLNGVFSIHAGNYPGKMLTYIDHSYGIVDYPDESSPFVAVADTFMRNNAVYSRTELQ